MRVQALGDDALQTLLGAGRQQRLSVADGVLGRLPALAVQRERAQQLAALG